MKIQYLNPASLVPYTKNAKTHPKRQIEALKEGIKTFGFDQPIVVDKNLVIIKGHGRTLAALELGLDEVPVVVRDISSRDAKFLRVADNEVATGPWDGVALTHEARDLAGTGFDLSLLGFELGEQDELLSDLPSVGASVVGTEIAPPVTTHTCSSCGYTW